MPHDKVTVESQRSVDNNLSRTRPKQSRQPPGFTGIHEEEDGVMLINKLFQLCDIRRSCIVTIGGDRMSGHRDHELMGSCILILLGIAQHHSSAGLTMAGKICRSRSAAHCAFGLPPSRQSSNWNRGCRTGFEYETRAESTKVMFRTPQPWTSVEMNCTHYAP